LFYKELLGERRASAGENLLNPGAIENLNHLVQPAPPSTAVPGSVEEEGEGYLSKYSGKRNTVHGASSPYGPSSPVPRHSPYTKASSTERRSSWASPAITAQQHQQLERLYRQAISGSATSTVYNYPVSTELLKQILPTRLFCFVLSVVVYFDSQTKLWFPTGGNDLMGIQALQKEFQRLGRIAAQGCSPTASRSPTHLFDHRAAPFGCPRISITDEHNRSLAPGSSSFDPVNLFEQKVNEVVFGQRPATVIGFASTSKSGTSSPEQNIKVEDKDTMDDRVKSFVSTLPLVDVVQELKNCLNEMQIRFEETNEVVYMDQAVIFAEMRRLSLSTGVEIGCATLPPEQKSHVEFAIVAGNQVRVGQLWAGEEHITLVLTGMWIRLGNLKNYSPCLQT
ncbi:hypothetical protein OESDEN_00313, partial [Oesophagostomum dentatum]